MFEPESVAQLLGASLLHAEDEGSTPAWGGFFSIFLLGRWSPSQPGLALTGRVEARLLNDLHSVDGGVKLLQKQTNKPLDLLLCMFVTLL